MKKIFLLLTISLVIIVSIGNTQNTSKQLHAYNEKTTVLNEASHRTLNELTYPLMIYENKLNGSIDSFIVIKGQNIEVREAASSKSTVVELKTNKGQSFKLQLEDGNFCKVLSIGPQEKIGEDNSNWYKIKYYNVIGWVYGKYIEPIEIDEQTDIMAYVGEYWAQLENPEIEGDGTNSEIMKIKLKNNELSVLIFISKNNQFEHFFLKSPKIIGYHLSSVNYNGIFVKFQNPRNNSNEIVTGIIINGFFYENTSLLTPPPLLQETITTENNNNNIFVVVEQMPTFPGGDNAQLKFFIDNLNYPVVAKTNHIEGVVYTNFIVEKDGSISDIAVLKGIGGGCNEEAVRIIKLMPKWNPGKQAGKNVRVQFVLPIKFSL